MSSYEYNQLLKFLYFEGFADSYEEAEYILEEMTDEDFEELIEAKDIPQEVAIKLADMLKSAPPVSRRGSIARGLRQYAVERNKKRLAKLQQNEEFEEVLEAYKEPDFDKMKRQEYRHTKKATSQSRGSRGDSKNRAFKMDTIRRSLERGEDPRRDTFGGKRTENPEDHRAAYTKNPMNNPPRRVKEPGVKKEEYVSERWDEPGERDSAQVRADNAYFAKKLKAKKAAQERMKAKGNVPKKGGKDMFEEKNKKMEGEDPCWDTHKMVGTKKKGGKEVPNCVPKEEFESVVEYLFVEGYADTIESAELMAENISENWMNEIIKNNEE